MPVRRLWPLLCVLACALPAVANAQSGATPGTAYAEASSADDAADTPTPPPGTPFALPTPGAFTLDSALTFDPAALAAAPAKPLRLPGYSDGRRFDINRADKPDGSSSVTVNAPLPIDVETKVSADLAPAPSSINVPGRPLPGSTNAYDSGAAWASVGVPNLAALEARVDPDTDQGKIGTTLHHAVPIGSKLSVTLQDTFSVTDTLGARSASGSSEPLLAALPPTPAAPTQIWGNEQKLKFDVLPTGTSLSAGVVTSSVDPVTHNTFSADQKVYGPLHVTTSVNDVGEPTSSKSITAGFKLNW